jgi:Transposase DDE domain
MKNRKYLSADGLLGIIKKGTARIFATRPEKTRGSVKDAFMSAYAMFSLKYPSLLAFDKDRKNENLHSVYGVSKIPSDTNMRVLLDEVDPEGIRTIFNDIFRILQRGKVLEKFVFMANSYLLSIDGTGFFSSDKVHCNSCLEKTHKNGSVSYSHQMLGAVIVHPDRKEVIPLTPEPIVKQDGQTKNDCERNATKRFLEKFRKDHPNLKVIVIEDGLSSNAPHIRELIKHNMHFILGAKEGDHEFLFEQIQQAHNIQLTTSFEMIDPRNSNIILKFRFLNNVQLNKSNTDIFVNVLECSEFKNGTFLRKFAWVTDFTLAKNNAYDIMRGGRTRWKIENETFNTLKNQGYHFEHNFGHGYNNLSTVFALLMMLAFLVDQIQQICCPLFQQLLAKLGSKATLWAKTFSIFDNFLFSSMRQVFLALLYGFKKPVLAEICDSS